MMPRLVQNAARARFLQGLTGHRSAFEPAIVYIPIGALSPTKLKKLRAVHVLDSYERRKEAKEFIW